MTCKRDQVREFICREVKRVIAETTGEMNNRETAEVVRRERDFLASQIAWHICEEYRFLELADIMEWKRTRVRR